MTGSSETQKNAQSNAYAKKSGTTTDTIRIDATRTSGEGDVLGVYSYNKWKQLQKESSQAIIQYLRCEYTQRRPFQCTLDTPATA